MTEQKRGRGRPKKVVEQKNPDCEPATKGFVKCVARRLQDFPDHTGSLLKMATISLAAIVPCLLFYIATRYEVAFMVILVLAVVTAHDLILSFLVFVPSDEPDFIQKYTSPEPACEKKKECE